MNYGQVVEGIAGMLNEHFKPPNWKWTIKLDSKQLMSLAVEDAARGVATETSPERLPVNFDCLGDVERWTSNLCLAAEKDLRKTLLSHNKNKVKNV